VSAHIQEIKRREKAALAAIREAIESEEDETGATLFVSHHLEEIEAAYWEEHLGTDAPEPQRIVDILELRSHWSPDDDDGNEVFDFTLPDNVTDYVISVHFDDDGNVDDIRMEG
jgi:hypothetical protein